MTGVVDDEQAYVFIGGYSVMFEKGGVTGRDTDRGSALCDRFHLDAPAMDTTLTTRAFLDLLSMGRKPLQIVTMLK